MKSMEWYELELCIPQLVRDSLSNRLFELGSTGIAERDGADGMVYLSSAFAEKDREAVERELTIYLQSLSEMMKGESLAWQINWKTASPVKWEDQYKRFYFAQRLNRTFYLRPTWDSTTRVPEEMIEIEMDPGQAFGTGLHATTRVTMTAIEDCLKFFMDPGTVSFLDVGTGSGVLSIAAHKLGVRNITAIDNDPVAVEVAEKNFEINHCDNITLNVNPLSELKGSFLVVASNILLETHRQLFSQYRRVADEKGFLILSGILVSQRAELSAVAEAEGFKEISFVAQQEWMASIFTRAKVMGIR